MKYVSVRMCKHKAMSDRCDVISYGIAFLKCAAQSAFIDVKPTRGEKRNPVSRRLDIKMPIMQPTEEQMAACLSAKTRVLIRGEDKGKISTRR